MNTLVHTGRRMPYTNAGTTTIAAGTPVEVGAILGIAVADIAASDTGVLDIGVDAQVHELAKASGAISQGEQLYWDDGNSNITTAPTGNVQCGVAWEDAVTAATTVKVALNLNAA